MPTDEQQIADGVEKIADKRIEEAAVISAIRRMSGTQTFALVVIVAMLSVALGIIIGLVGSIDHTVTSHNTELSQTLHAACVLIKSDPKLPVPSGCLP